MATTIRTGAIYGIGVYGTDRYGISNVLHIPDGVDVAALVGSFFVTGTANVSVDGVSVSAFAGSLDVAASAVTSITGVSLTASVDTVVVSGKATELLVGVEFTTNTGSFIVEAKASVSVDGVASSIVVEDVVVSGAATSSVSGVEVSFDNGSVVVLENEVVVLSGVTVTAYIDAVSVVTTAFPFVPEDYDAERVVYVEARTPAIQRFIYVEQQPRIVIVEEKENSYTRTSNVARQYRQTYINRGTTSEERTILVEE